MHPSRDRRWCRPEATLRIDPAVVEAIAGFVSFDFGKQLQLAGIGIEESKTLAQCQQQSAGFAKGRGRSQDPEVEMFHSGQCRDRGGELFCRECPPSRACLACMPERRLADDGIPFQDAPHVVAGEGWDWHTPLYG